MCRRRTVASDGFRRQDRRRSIRSRNRISAEYSKRITDDLGISIGRDFTRLRVPGGPSSSGFQNLETTFKYQFMTVPEAEFVMSAGLSVEWAHTGRAAVGAEQFNVLTPLIWFGKGLGDLPDTFSWARPFAITGQIGYQVPTWSRTVTWSLDPDSGDLSSHFEQHARFLNWGGSLQYNLRYLQSNVVDIGLPDAIARTHSYRRNAVQHSSRLSRKYWVKDDRLGQSRVHLGRQSVPTRSRSDRPDQSREWARRRLGGSASFVSRRHFPTTVARPIIPGVLPTTIGRPTVTAYQGTR